MYTCYLSTINNNNSENCIFTSNYYKLTLFRIKELSTIVLKGLRGAFNCSPNMRTLSPLNSRIANVSFSSLDKRKCVQKIFQISLRIKFCKIIINKNVVYHLNYQRQIKFTKKSWLEQKKFLRINISTANHVHENLLNRIVDIWDHLTLDTLCNFLWNSLQQLLAGTN